MISATDARKLMPVHRTSDEKVAKLMELIGQQIEKAASYGYAYTIYDPTRLPYVDQPNPPEVKMVFALLKLEGYAVFDNWRIQW